MDLYPWAEGCSKKWSEWHPNSNHWFTTSFLRKKVPESDARSVSGTQPEGGGVMANTADDKFSRLVPCSGKGLHKAVAPRTQKATNVSASIAYCSPC